VEDATSYDVQWSTSPSFATSPVTHNFKAVGDKGDVWILNNGTGGVTGNPFTNGQTYYFQVRSRNAVGPASAWTVYGGGSPTGVIIGPTTGANTVTGTVTIPAGVTPTGPLFVGFFDMSTGNGYGDFIAAPVVGANAYTVHVPSGSNYFNFAILDQNNDGMIDAGDVTNTDNANSAVTISGNLTGQNLTLPSAGSTAAVTTQYSSGTSPGGSFAGYTVSFDVRAANKLPVAVQLTSGPNVVNPVDIGNACQGCGTVQFQMYTNIGGVPSVGDSYSFHVTYIDGTSETVTGAVTAFGSGTAIVGASDLATNLTPNETGTSTTPTFTLTDPVGGSAYVYSFYLSDSNGNTIWQIPGNNSKTNGFSSSITSITWGTDPTGGGSTPVGGSLTSGAQYNWSITIQDTKGNQAQSSVYYIP
jgi:hypothetical protein